MTSARHLHPPDDAPGLRIVSDAAGRVRFDAPGLRSATGLAVAVEEALDGVEGVRQVHAFPRTGSLVVWYDRDHCSPATITEAYRGVTASTPHDEPATRLPRSAEVGNGDLLRMAVGGLALLLLGGRRWVLRRPPMLGPTSRTVATGVTIFTGYPFLRGALRALVGGRGAGTDALVSAATVASLVLRENVVALTVLWLLNIGEYLQDLTLRRSRRAISDLLTGARTTTWMRVAPADPAGEAVEVEVPIDRVRVDDEIVVHEHVVLPVDGVVVEASELGCLVDQAAITGENLPVTVEVGDALHAGSVLLRGRLVVRATAVGSDTAVGRIIERVEAAQSDRAPIQTVGENFSRRFVPLSFARSSPATCVGP
jgi:manganese/zinc-transporting P-type ATPase C